MYRLLKVSTYTKNHLKTLSSIKYTAGGCGCQYTTTKYGQMFSTFFPANRKLLPHCFNDEKTQLSPSGLSLIMICCQSTTTSAGLQNDSRRKIKRFRHKKFTELLQIKNGTYTQTRAAIKKLRSQRLVEFINKINLESSTKSNKSLKTSTSTKLKQAKENQQHNLIQLNDKVFIKTNSAEESPILFVGKDTIKINEKSTAQLRDIMESYRIFREFNSVAETPTDFISEEPVDFINNPQIFGEDVETLEDEPVEEHIDPIQTITATEKKKTKLTASKKKTYEGTSRNEEAEKLCKNHTLVSNLTTYLELCVSGGMVNRGFATLLMYRYKCKRQKNMLPITNINLYNILLSGYAEKMNFGKVKEILSVLKEDKIMCNAQTYAAIFECLGRSSNNGDNTKQIRKYSNEANSIGITLNDILDKSKFVADKREIVLQSIHLIEPDFRPIYTPPILTYDNKLVNSLNRNVRPATDCFHEIDNISGAEIMNSKRGFSMDELYRMNKDQLNAEFSANVTIKSIQEFPPIDQTVINYRKKLTELDILWRNQIRFAFYRDLSTLKAQTHSKGNRAINLLPYLRALTVEQCADILVHEIKTLSEGSETFSLTVNQLYKQLGHRVQSKYHMNQKISNGILEKTKEVYKLYCDAISTGHSSDNPRQCWQRIVYQNRNNGASMDNKDRIWPLAVTIGVGRFLYQILMRDVKIDANILRSSGKNGMLIPAFYTLFRNEGRVIKEEIKPHPVLAKLYRGSQNETLSFPSNTVPMLCPPQPWTTPHNGGYLLARSELIRLPYQAYQQWDQINTAKVTDIYPSYDSLNQLASIPWKVHTELLDVVLQVFNSGGSKELDVPQPPSALKPLEFNSKSILTNAEKYERFRQQMSHRRKQAEMYSLWCEALYRLSLANHYRDKVFWLPHNMDFRGRVYPIPPHLNHLGSDLARSLLVFHQKQPLGPNGFDWLKLHCINLTGIKKKSSINDRLCYANEIMADIIDSADNPLTGQRWWTKSDEPWQTLGVCMEIAKVARCPDPVMYMSSMPIHQDGSCNGLQHYAALGRDEVGAISVNLAQSILPQDVYSAVATVVEKTRQTDEENGIEIAKILNGYVQRKVIKQTVMTTVYGVTRYGARLQIAKQLKDIDSFPKDEVWRASSYLTTKTFDSLREMFTSTKEIQDWFTHCARLIAAIRGQNVDWITPLGLPIVQPYNRTDKILPKLSQKKMSMDLYTKPNVMKQKNAFPPNFIHSLDSTHMMLTSLHCERAGLTFISVHDCYWTHPGSVKQMSRICREQFVALHSEQILENLSKYLVQQHGYRERDFQNNGSILDSTKRKLNKVLRQIPARGDFDLQNVLKSVYFFS